MWYFMIFQKNLAVICVYVYACFYLYNVLSWKSWDLKSKANREQPANHEQDRQRYIEDLKRYIETVSKPSATVTKQLI